MENPKPLTVVSFGGGENSTAMLIELTQRNEIPGLILFADTGDEHQYTYDFIPIFSKWLTENGAPPVVTVKRKFRYETLFDECIDKGQLPSKAYGFAGCSSKWKRDVMDKAVKEWPLSKREWSNGRKISRLIGIYAGESHRGKIPETTRYTYRYPLIEWDIDGDDCRQIIKDAGIPAPGKSSCFYCPAKKKAEVLTFAREEPEQFQRAIEIEESAKAYNTKVKGLGRNWSWSALVEADKSQLRLFPEAPTFDCMCFDGEE